jgi:hypothetical protein
VPDRRGRGGEGRRGGVKGFWGVPLAERARGRAGGVAAAVPDRRGRGGGGAAGGGGGGGVRGGLLQWDEPAAGSSMGS